MTIWGKEKRRARTLLESDFLLGVCDETRIGGLRFAEEDGAFLTSDETLKPPPWTKLRALENAATAFENGGDPEEFDMTYKGRPAFSVSLHPSSD